MRLITHLQQPLVLRLGVSCLLGEDAARVPLVAGPEHQQTAEEQLPLLARELLVLDGDATALLEAEDVEAAESGGVLILLADRLPEDVHLDVRGLLGELSGRDALASIGVERV